VERRLIYIDAKIGLLAASKNPIIFGVVGRLYEQIVSGVFVWRIPRPVF
jgi:hypothetical protein